MSEFERCTNCSLTCNNKINVLWSFPLCPYKPIKENRVFNIEDIKQCAKSKTEIWNELHGKTVKCFTVSEENYQLFAVQDIESKNIYFLDYQYNK